MTGFDGWTEHDPDQSLLGFAVNPLHNVVHLLLGLAGLVMSRREVSARGYGWLLVIGYGAVLVYGLLVGNQRDGNVLNINSADNVLHALSVVAGLATALWPRESHRDDLHRDTRRSVSRQTPPPARAGGGVVVPRSSCVRLRVSVRGSHQGRPRLTTPR